MTDISEHLRQKREGSIDNKEKKKREDAVAKIQNKFGTSKPMCFGARQGKIYTDQICSCCMFAPECRLTIKKND